MKLHLLGVNGPFPESNGATSGYLLEAGDALFQFDLGSGILGRLTALTAPESVTARFLSHWHFDHAADVPVLMYRLEAMKQVLPVYAPEDPDSADGFIGFHAPEAVRSGPAHQPHQERFRLVVRIVGEDQRIRAGFADAVPEGFKPRFPRGCLIGFPVQIRLRNIQADPFLPADCAAEKLVFV